jgi:hypothetical protein
MRSGLVLSSLPFVALFLALAPTAMASNTWYVDGVNGGDNNNCKSRQHACKTIGHAISLASSGDSVKVAAAPYVENLAISSSLRIVGAGALTTVIDGGGIGSVVSIGSSSTHVTLANLTIENGMASDGAGVFNAGTLTINNCIIIGNHAKNQDGGFGGGVFNRGTARIRNSTLSGNAVHFGGGGIYNMGPMTINSSTLSGNSGVLGAGIDNAFTTGRLTISNSTFNGNIGYQGGGISNGGTIVVISNSTISGNSAVKGGGIDSGTYTKLQNTIVANSRGANCYRSGFISKGYNLSSDNTCNFHNTGDRNNTDPKLGTLGNYGGPTQTIPLLSGSPAIDAGNPNGCTDGNGHLLKTDQRGKSRPDREDTSGCDMGAYERQSD